MFLQIRKGLLGLFLCFSCVLVLGISGSVILLSEGSPNKINFNVTGLMPAALTSLYDNYTVNVDSIPAYVDYLVENQLKSVLVGGSSGEHMFLSVNDRKQIIAAWANASEGKDLHVQVQVGGAPFADVIDLAKFCSTIGVDSVLTLPDLYHKPKTVQELVSYVELVAKAAPNLPIFYYHIPKNTQVNIKMPEFVEAALKQISNFRGIKFTATDLAEAGQVLRILQGDQRIFLGGEELLAPAVLIGIDSCTSPAANLFPSLMRKIMDAVKNGNVSEAIESQRTLTSLVTDISAQGGRIPAMKVAMEYLTGIQMGPPALPAKPVTAEARARIEQRLFEQYVCQNRVISQPFS